MSKKDWPILPVSVDAMAMGIVDATGARVLDIRGWGRLTGHGHGGLQLPHDMARANQEALLQRLAAFLNGGGA